MSDSLPHHRFTSPLEPSGVESAHILQCDRCGFREQDLSRSGRACGRMDPTAWPSRDAPCKGTLCPMRVKGWRDG